MTAKFLKLASAGLIVVVLSSAVSAAGSLRVMKLTAGTETPGLKYSCAWPRLSGIQDQQRQQKLNIRFREMALTQKTSAEEAARVSPQAGFQGGCDYEVTRNRNGILSIVFRGSLTGGGKTRSTEKGITVDTVSGAAYRLGDLFFDRADYALIIGDKVKKQMNQRSAGTKPAGELREIRDTTDFYLTDDSLVIFLGHKGASDEEAVEKFAITLQSLEGSLKPSLRLST